jgi:uncharacterized protein DUF4255/carboxypeptidase family protein
LGLSGGGSSGAWAIGCHGDWSVLSDLDETLKQLLIQRGGLSPAAVDISFDIPTRDWSTPVTKPTVNLYLYDIRENRELRETYWEREVSDNGSVTMTRGPVRLDISYMLTCWTSQATDQHLLLWRVLETFFRHSPLPQEVLQGTLSQSQHPVRTQVAQPDGILRNVSDFWGALENQLRPAVSLVVTVELDLKDITTVPLVFARVAKVGLAELTPGSNGRERELVRLSSGWEVGPAQIGGLVCDPSGRPVPDASVHLVGIRDGQPIQVRPTVVTDSAGRYAFSGVPPGQYTLIAEAPGRPPQQYALTVAARDRGEAVPELTHRLEVPMADG